MRVQDVQVLPSQAVRDVGQKTDTVGNLHVNFRRVDVARVEF